MCCFSGPVKEVSSTNIFAREGPGKSQFVVYEMRVEARREVAMVLPLPVDQAKGENAVSFINLEEYPWFFYDLDRGFRLPANSSAAGASLRVAKSELRVFEVGEFEASYVPTIHDFERLDPRFRLPGTTWEAIPQYRNYGFAVFKLKKGRRSYHPMAFSFERQSDRHLFFPTMHIHDLKLHRTAKFDHSLYCQPHERALETYDWDESYTHAQFFTDIQKSKGIIAPEQHCYQRIMRGRLPNQDTFLRTVA